MLLLIPGLNPHIFLSQVDVTKKKRLTQINV
uniref:Uncharacterized protein n=1 Tax=Anguilla anguilla TaxID=7936 RepID=A0A0E9PZK8_ANGAN